jgi:riboflavin kinase / FMN adenylyltransferase
VQIIYGYKAVEQAPGPVVMTLGTFDGLHVGHRAIIELVVERARKTGCKALVYSFFPPPWRVLGRGKHPYLILTLRDKIDLLAELGVDILVTEEFDPELQRMLHVDFAGRVLRDLLDPREIHVGYDFRFGKDRLGDHRFLERFFADRPTQIRPHGAVRIDGQVAGCSRIRELVRTGEVRDAAPLLGRWHFVRGAVVRGRGRGTTIGVPTANIAPRTELVPPAGVYAVQMRVGDEPEWRPGVANLGFRPTFAEKEFSIEVHLFDFDGDLYGERVLLSFIERIRDERRFDSAEQLVAQIGADVAAARALLPYGQPPGGELTWDPKPL